MRLVSQGTFRHECFGRQFELVSVLCQMREANSAEQKREIVDRVCDRMPLEQLNTDNVVGRIFEQVRQVRVGAKHAARVMGKARAQCTDIESRLARNDELSRREVVQLQRDVDAAILALEKLSQRPAHIGAESRTRWAASRVPFRVCHGPRRARAVRRSPRRTPRRAQADSGGSDGGDGGDGPPGCSSCPTEALNLTVEGAHPSRLRRLRTSVGQPAFCANEARRNVGGSR